VPVQTSGEKRAYLVALGAAFLCMLVVLISTSGATGAPEPRADASAGVSSQLKKLKSQVAQLQAQLAQVTKQQGPPGPQGQQGIQGPPGPTPGTVSGGVGGQIIDNTVDNADLAPNAEFSGTQVPFGDLAGSFYPSPTLALDSVGVNEISTDSVGFNELMNSSVGSLEVNDGALELQDLVVESDSVAVVPGDPTMSDECLVETTASGQNVDANDFVLTSLPVDAANILVTTGSVNSPGGVLDITVCNPISTVVASPATVNWAVIEVP
jgi:hypothetical protein